MTLETFVRMFCEKILPHCQDSSLPVANNDVIPDGFYLVCDENSPQDAWAKSIIDGVRKITHITKPDPKGQICGVKISQEGVFNVGTHAAYLCSGSTKNAKYATTTEVYPDSTQAGVTSDQCNDAQVAVVTSGLDHILEISKNE